MSKYDDVYMRMASTFSEMSYANRRKVGCLIVKDNRIISDGYNGSISGFPNECEDIIGRTLPEVLHAESNAITKLAKHGVSSDGATLYVTLSPCLECSKLIVQSGIKRVVYQEEYRITTGIELLKKAKIEVEQIQL